MREQLNFPGAQLAIRLDREVRDGEDTQVLFETRYFIASLDPEAVTPRGLMGYGRGHWQVENSLHFVKDRWWDEDRHYSKRPGLAEALALLVSVALTVLRVCGHFEDKSPLRARADHLSWTPREALQVIGVRPRTDQETNNPNRSGATELPKANERQLL
jgi:Transposase DDE domain